MNIIRNLLIYLISVERGTHLSQFLTDGVRAGRIVQVSMDEGVYKADASVRAGKNQIAEYVIQELFHGQQRFSFLHLGLLNEQKITSLINTTKDSEKGKFLTWSRPFSLDW